MKSQLRPAFVLLVLLTLVTGVAYPAAVTGLAQLMFARQANGSLIVEPDGTAHGSALIGQPFSDSKYFWSRPSATSAVPYDAAAGSGSNLGPTNPALTDAVKARVAALRPVDPANESAIPADLVTASASGLDPHVSPAAARYQVARVARARNRPVADVAALVERYTEARSFGFLGEPVVNVLALNLALDGHAPPVTTAGAAAGSRWPAVTQ